MYRIALVAACALAVACDEGSGNGGGAAPEVGSPDAVSPDADASDAISPDADAPDSALPDRAADDAASDVDAALPACEGDAPVYIWPYVHHYLGGGGIYPRAADVEAVADLAEELDINLTLFFDGILAAELRAEAPGLLRELGRRSGLAFGYHGEETHGPYPVPYSMNSPELSFTADLGWEAAYNETTRYAERLLDYAFLDPTADIRDINRGAGGTLTSEPGGVSLVARDLDLSVATYHGLESPPVQLAFDNAAPVDVMQGTYPLSAHALPRDADLEAIFGLAGEHDIYFHLGALTTKEWPDAELPHGDPRGIGAALAAIDRSRPRLVVYLGMFEPGDTALLERDLLFIRDEFLADNPGSRFVAPTDPAGLVAAPLEASVTRRVVASLARACVDEGRDGVLPEYFEVRRRHYSLAEAFSILVDALAEYDASGELASSVEVMPGLLGPIADADERVAGRTGAASVGDLLSLATDLRRALDRPGSASRPSHVPYASALGGRDVHAAQVLMALARAYVALEEGLGDDSEVSLDAVSDLTDYSDVFVELTPLATESDPTFGAMLQLWSAKPAPFVEDCVR